MFKIFKSEEDSNTVLSYILTLHLLSMFYLESIKIHEKLMNFVNNTETILDEDDKEDNNIKDKENENENGEDDEGDEEDDDEGDDDDEDVDVNEEEELDSLLMKALNIINDNSNNELNEVIDDDIRIYYIILEILTNITTEDDENSNLDELIGDSKIGQLAKEISSQIDVDSLNLDINNPSELLNPANLFGGDNGNILGNLVQQVGSSITEKMNQVN